MEGLNLTGQEIYDTLTAFTKNPLEVEFKMKVPKKMFISMIDSFDTVLPDGKTDLSSDKHILSDDKMTLEQTSNAIYAINANTNLIMSKNYSTGKISKYTKKRIMYAQLADFPNISISVALEEDAKIDPPKGSVAMFRIKNRLSFIRGDWRYDFTQTIQIDPDTIKPNIQALANNLFGGE